MALSELRALPSDVRGPPVRLLLSGRFKRSSRTTGFGGRADWSLVAGRFATGWRTRSAHCVSPIRALVWSLSCVVGLVAVGLDRGVVQKLGALGDF